MAEIPDIFYVEPGDEYTGTDGWYARGRAASRVAQLISEYPGLDNITAAARLGVTGRPSVTVQPDVTGDNAVERLLL